MTDAEFVAAGWGVLCAAAAWVLRRREAWAIADEGYLWYGVQRVRAGEIPLRDFRSYEPGRYLWCAALNPVFGTGLAGVRRSANLLFALALATLLPAVSVVGASPLVVLVLGVALAAVSHPQHKLFEHSVVLLAVATTTLAVATPDPVRLGLVGAVVGLAAAFGLNLGLYVGLGAVVTLIVAVAAGQSVVAAVIGLAVGSVVGVLPLLVTLRHRGVAATLWQRRVRALLDRGTANLAIPVPWPWRPPADRGALGPTAQRTLGLLFVMLLGAPVVVLVVHAIRDTPSGDAWPAVVGAAAVGLGLSHHALSRADVHHAAQAVGPTVVIVLAWAGHHAGVFVAVTAVTAAVLGATVLEVHPRRRRRASPDQFTFVPVGDDEVWMHRRNARLLELVHRRLPADPAAGVLVVPDVVGLLAAADRRSPVYDTYCVHPASDAEQRAMIDQIAQGAVALAVVNDRPIDGDDALRFRHTHPLVWAHLEATMDPVDNEGIRNVAVFVASPSG